MEKTGGGEKDNFVKKEKAQKWGSPDALYGTFTVNAPLPWQ